MNKQNLIGLIGDATIMVAALGGLLGCLYSLGLAALLATISIVNRVRLGRFMWPPHPFGRRPSGNAGRGT